ncbi:hypothetical protein PCASD_08762 [Puccinia coronata f. sp. avenae]|uniref:Uncharacterized protein n=1 Tax=Puccinia coronata f. sp. avenae TaxID=200324 RepID=A0A2N5UPB1_9BASI|nr:hypothetical protein PCASD_08762 [Puccinia coronata f. sp. avenae]
MQKTETSYQNLGLGSAVGSNGGLSPREMYVQIYCVLDGIKFRQLNPLGVQTPARPPPHAARRPHTYKWREDGRLGVQPRRKGVLAMHACPARLT